MLKETQREWYCDRIREQFYKSYNGNQASFEPPLLRRIDEVIEALALGCTLARPRQFGTRYMEAKDFRRIADKIDGNIVAVRRGVPKKKGKTVEKRGWDLFRLFLRFCWGYFVCICCCG